MELDYQVLQRSLPPQNVEVEEAILGGILLDPEALERVINLLKVEAFYIPAHQDIYRAAVALEKEGKPKDLISVSAWLTDHNLLEKAGGLNKLVQLVERTVSAVNIDALATLVMEKYLRRQLIKLGNFFSQIAYDTAVELPEALEKCQAGFLNILKQAESKESTAQHISEILPDVHQQIEMNNSGENAAGRFLSTGFYDIDEKTGGLPQGYFSTLAARANMGKTTFAIELAVQIAIKKKAVVYFTLEMSKDDIATKILARLSAPELLANQLFHKNAITKDSEWEALATAIGIGSELPIWVDDRSSVTALDIRTTLQKIRSQTEIGLVVIDYVGLMLSMRSTNNRVTEIDETLKELRAIAKDFSIPILGLAQINRGVEGRNNKRPMMSDIRESGAYEQESAVILTLYSDAYYNPDTPDRGIAEIGIAKSRFGERGAIVKLVSKPEHGQFLNMAKPQNSHAPQSQPKTVQQPSTTSEEGDPF